MISLLVASVLLPAQGLKQQFADIALAAKGRVGACAMLIETGERVSLDGAGKYPMQSVYKVPIAMAALFKVQSGSMLLTTKVAVERSEMIPKGGVSPIRDAYPKGVNLTMKSLLDYSVRVSDGTASDVLLRVAGGPAVVNKYVANLGITGINVATTEMQQVKDPSVQYQNWSTPDAMVSLLAHLQTGQQFRQTRGVLIVLSKANRGKVLAMMASTTTFPGRLKGKMPPRTRVAHKTGSSGTRSGLTAATNDVGIITLPSGKHIAIAVFVSDSPADAKTRDGVIAAIGRAAYDYWNR